MQFEARFYETYNMCDVISGFLKHPFDHALWLEGFHCDEQWAGWLAPYEKRSVLHQFIAFVVQGVHSEQAGDFDIKKQKSIYANFKDIPPAIADMQPHKLPIERAFEHHGIDHQTFFEFLKDEGKTFEEADADDIYEYMNEVWISAAYEELIEQTVGEVFHVLFQNRELMIMFNVFVSSILELGDWDRPEDLDRSLLAPSGKLARVRPPSWARRAVFFRDRGRCVLCDRDLTGLLNIDNVENYDHIVPLSSWGLNDITNLQLLCVPCNQHEKRDSAPVTSGRYQSWYPMDDSDS
ncbi:HNH endonuclease [Ideonella sp. B7]|uniref:HNH endonuclease n=1 Tax=Ideonella benzenivorans TaxID=2831643 RepID=UPI001CEC106E|nr:HNH endonuclease signature motif containing protein [Ideonella benzenivorans]MCA6218837.1 HNH endonuclease [Ideonella benzenivorans]